MSEKITTTIIVIEIEVQCHDVTEAKICAGSIKSVIEDKGKNGVVPLARKATVLGCKVSQTVNHKFEV